MEKLFKLFVVLAMFTTAITASAIDDDERKKGYFEVGYMASSFDDVKGSGSYGISWTSMPWRIGGIAYAGLHFSPFNFNFGLVDSDYTTDVICLGPALGFYFGKSCSLMVPLDVMCIYGVSSKNDKLRWGMSLSPAIYVGHKGGLYAGPFFSMGFDAGSKVSTGFRAGIFF